MPNLKQTLLLLISLFLFSCSEDEPEVMLPPQAEEPTQPVETPITSATVDLQVGFNPTFENTFYPSWWYAISSYSVNYGINEDPSFIVTYKEPKLNAEVKIEFEETRINKKTIVQQVSTSEGNTVVLAPKINWDYEALKNINAPGSLSVPVNIYVDNSLISTKYIAINYRSVNECLFIYSNEGEIVEAYDMFASYVNEDHPEIDAILEEILNQGIVKQFNGYSDGDSGLINQVAAIWYWMQSKGVKYSSITNSSFNSPSGNLASQYVRFFDEVLENNQANCADGTVFLASILRKIGLDPLIILVPGHMYLGINSSEGGLFLIETTIVGAVDLRTINTPSDLAVSYSNNQLSSTQYEEYLLGQASFAFTKYRISINSLNYALNYAANDYNNNSDKFFKQPQYSIINIKEARTRINPIK